MKIEKRENVKGVIRTVVFYNNERYLRLQKSQYNGLDMNPVVEWKKEKTNHLVKADKHKMLEEKFSTVDVITKPATQLAKTMSSGTTMIFDFKPAPVKKSYEDKKVDVALIEECKAGRKLGAVKMYKDFTGLGLKESKDYVDGLYSSFLAEVKWDDAMSLTNMALTREQKELVKINSFFESNAKRKQFISDAKRNAKDSGKLFAVKTIKDKTGWGLYESKLFFDTYVG